MPLFETLVKNVSGDNQTVRREASSRSMLLAALRSEGLTPVRIQEVQTRSMQEWITGLRKRPSRKDTMNFIRNFAALVRSGMDVEKCLGALVRESKGAMRKVAEDLQNSINHGERLSSAMARSKAFTEFQIKIIRAGEYGGNLHEALQRLAHALESENDLRSRVINAMVYPLFIVCFGLVSAVVMIVFVLPKFLGLYSELNTKLPPLTQFVLDFSGFISNNAIWLLPLILILIVAAIRFLADYRRSLFADKLRMRIPLIGRMLLELKVASFLRTFGLLLQSGIPIPEALHICSDVADSALFSQKLREMEDGLLAGKRLSSEMANHGFFSETIRTIVSVGEEGGDLPRLLIEAAEELDQRADRTIKSLLTLLEPMLILLVGSLVGIMVLAMLLPIFNLSASLRR